MFLSLMQGKPRRSSQNRRRTAFSEGKDYSGLAFQTFDLTEGWFMRCSLAIYGQGRMHGFPLTHDYYCSEALPWDLHRFLSARAIASIGTT